MTVLAQCDGSTTTDCGWRVEHRDEDGDPHTVRDWWITGADMARYVEMHREFSEKKP